MTVQFRVAGEPDLMAKKSACMLVLGRVHGGR
jgi:hypothetical protein